MKAIFFKLLVLLVLVCQTAIAQYKLYEAGVKAFKAQKWDETITNLTDFLSKELHDKGNDHEVNYILGVAYYKNADYLSAMKAFDEAVRLNPNHQHKGSIHWHLAICCEKLNQPNESIMEYNNAIDAYKADKNTHSKLLVERGKVYQSIKSIDKAKADFEQALALNATNAEAKSLLDQTNTVLLASNRTVGGPTKQVTPPVETKKQDTEKQNAAEDKKVETLVVNKPQEKPIEKTQPAPPPATRSEGTQPVVTNNAQPTAQPPVQQPVVEAPKEPTLAELYADEKRYALVIGNSSYPQNIGMLKNPKNDAQDIADELRKSGFDVNLLIDATYGEMRKGIYDFEKTLSTTDRNKTVALFYYAGHGVQAMDENWLIPVDPKITIENEDDIRVQCVPVQSMLLSKLNYANARMKIVILDACRNNPFPSVNRSVGGGSGLKEVSRARGSWIAFATAPGSVAADGNGRNGIYTTALLEAMRKPGVTIEQTFKMVRQKVDELSGGKQETWDNSNIIGDFYFKLK
jgi:hypothetical protein